MYMWFKGSAACADQFVRSMYSGACYCGCYCGILRKAGDIRGWPWSASNVRRGWLRIAIHCTIHCTTVIQLLYMLMYIIEVICLSAIRRRSLSGSLAATLPEEPLARALHSRRSPTPLWAYLALCRCVAHIPIIAKDNVGYSGTIDAALEVDGCSGDRIRRITLAADSACMRSLYGRSALLGDLLENGRSMCVVPL